MLKAPFTGQPVEIFKAEQRLQARRWAKKAD